MSNALFGFVIIVIIAVSSFLLARLFCINSIKVCYNNMMGSKAKL
jgi:hypothetical protein